MIALTKKSVEIRYAPKAAVKRNIKDGGSADKKQVPCVLKTDLGEVLLEGHARLGKKKSAEIFFIFTVKCRKRGQGELL